MGFPPWNHTNPQSRPWESPLLLSIYLSICLSIYLALQYLHIFTPQYPIAPVDILWNPMTCSMKMPLKLNPITFSIMFQKSSQWNPKKPSPKSRFGIASNHGFVHDFRQQIRDLVLASWTWDAWDAWDAWDRYRRLVGLGDSPRESRRDVGTQLKHRIGFWSGILWDITMGNMNDVSE